MGTEHRRPATMLDVAQRAGVSRSLVSTVFRGVPGASPTTRDRIMQAAAELGYRPDVRARQLRSHGNNLIGVTLTAVHPFHVSVVEDLHDTAALAGFELSISLSTGTRSLSDAVDTLLAHRCAAIILVGPTAPDEEIEAIALGSPGVPVVVVDGHADVPCVDAVRVDDVAGMTLVIDHLVRLGHRRIWHADGGEYVSASPRRRAYVAAMTAHGLQDEIHVIPTGGSAMDGAASAIALAATRDLPTAIACYNDRVAFGFIDVLWRNGIRIPEDVSIAGFDDIREAGMPHLSLTTVAQRSDLLVAEAAGLVMDRLGGAPPRGLRLMPPGALVVRSSTGPPRLRVAAG